MPGAIVRAKRSRISVRLRWIAGTRMCDDQSPSSCRISSAKSVSSAWIPASASAAFSSISSVVSDFTFTTSSTPCARATSGDDRVRLGRVARPVHRDRPPPRPPPRTARRYSSRSREHVRLDRAARLAQLLPVGQLGDDAARAWRGSCPSRCAGWRAAAGSRSSRRAALGKARPELHCRRQDLREVHRAHARPATREPAADLQQARAVERGADLRAASPRSRSHLSASIARDVSAFLIANVPPKPQHSSRARQLDQLEPAHVAQQPQRRVADARHAQRVAGRVVGDAVRERRADVVDARAVRRAAPTARRAVSSQPVQLAHRADARRRRARRPLVAARRCAAKRAGEPRPPRAVAAVQVHLPAAGLLLREDDLVPEPLQHRDAAREAPGNSVSPMQVAKSAIFTAVGHLPRGATSRPVASLAGLRPELNEIQPPTSTAPSTLSGTWWQQAHGDADRNLLVAYFSMEFGVDERLPIYSGGLGVLAGDHLKGGGRTRHPARRRRAPLPGRLLRAGARRDGAQTERLRRRSILRRGASSASRSRSSSISPVGPIERERLAQGRRLRLPARPLYLLEVDWLTDALYGGDREHRMRQELLLGVGGVRALSALGIEPTVFHMNEGHSAFLALERIRSPRAERRGDARTRSSRCAARRSSRHTRRYRRERGLRRGGSDPLRRRARARVRARRRRAAGARTLRRRRRLRADAVRAAPLGYANGVSELHGEVAREMWAGLWPDRNGDAPPIGHITNGVHLGTWLEPQLAALVRQAGVRAGRCAGRGRVGCCSHGSTRGALWQVHDASRRRLAEPSPGSTRERLTIGFARRFATYKRAGLVFTDLERLLARARPDRRRRQGAPAGQRRQGGAPAASSSSRARLGAQGRSRLPRELRHRPCARAHPRLRRLAEQPAAPARGLRYERHEGGRQRRLNLSVLDGWWAEAHRPELGWAIEGVADEADAEQLYRLLEDAGRAACFFDDRPRWLAMMNSSIAQLAPRFSIHRALIEYVERYYLPAAR